MKAAASLNDTADEAFDRGYEAYYAGASDTHNPYPATSDQRLSWNDGYESARQNEEGDEE